MPGGTLSDRRTIDRQFVIMSVTADPVDCVADVLFHGHNIKLSEVAVHRYSYGEIAASDLA